MPCEDAERLKVGNKKGKYKKGEEELKKRRTGRSPIEMP